MASNHMLPVSLFTGNILRESLKGKVYIFGRKCAYERWTKCSDLNKMKPLLKFFKPAIL